MFVFYLVTVFMPHPVFIFINIQQIKKSIKFCSLFPLQHEVFRSVVEWLERRDCDRHVFGSKPTCAILLSPWERHFTALFPAWWSWQAALNFNHISIKLQPDSNILASPETGWGNYLPYVLAPPLLSCESGG